MRLMSQFLKGDQGTNLVLTESLDRTGTIIKRSEAIEGTLTKHGFRDKLSRVYQKVEENHQLL
jgi:hypothetical protein